MMTVVVDSGGSKTLWIRVEDGEVVATGGLNAHFCTDEEVGDACRTVMRRMGEGAVAKMIFYGAGCGSERQRERMRGLLQEASGARVVEVETDMMGACRATWGDMGGIVGILGTGSNACCYDGKSIVSKAASLGYILGDHGSANHVGRMLLLDYLTNKMPEEVAERFGERYKMGLDEWVEKIYHEPFANRKLAEVGRFAAENREDEYCRNTIRYALEEWFCYQVSDMVAASEWRRICVVGGFAAAVEDVLREVCEENRVMVGKVVSAPTEGLLAYHRKIVNMI